MSDLFQQFTLGSMPPKETLEIELVPERSWGANLRKALSRSNWDKLRKECYRKAGYRCEICGGKGPKHPVECHEVWEYEEWAPGFFDRPSVPLDEIGTLTQTLKGLIALCPACHEVKHFGLATARGREIQALSHLMKVNGWDSIQAYGHIGNARDLWANRSAFDWTLDLTWVESQGVDPPEYEED